ncbi:MAG: hypothetical protein IPO52_04060 [Gemmatimonadetes bacterium]|nr:hypothetical protein [Gemmatimonadota bacterium]
MATTLTLWLGGLPWTFLIRVGDSRYYQYRRGVLTQVTRDQTMAQELVDRGRDDPLGRVCVAVGQRAVERHRRPANRTGRHAHRLGLGEHPPPLQRWASPSTSATTASPSAWAP